MAKSILARQADGTVQLTITVPQEQIKKTYDEVLDDVAKKAKLSGFREGKAPKKLVEEKADKAQVYEEVIQKVVPQVYFEAIKEHTLAPIVSPKVELLKAQEGEDWEIRATTAEMPKVDLGNYKEEIKKTLATEKLWTPGKKPAAEKQSSGEDADEKTQKIIEILLKTVKIELPVILLEDEVNRLLSNLINQTEKLGLTVDQYLSSINKTTEQIRQEYKDRVEKDLKLQFTLEEIAKEEKMEALEKEIEDLISSAGDEKLKQELGTPLQKEYLKGILRRRKALDFLTKL